MLSVNQYDLLLTVGIIAALAVVAALLRIVLRGRAVTLPYERIERLCTPAERSFLGVLEQIFASEYRIFGKLRLADIICPCKGLSRSERSSAFNRIVGKPVDFAVCDLSTLEIIGVVELDDSSHGGSVRQRRDEFLDAALSAADVSVVHFRAQRAYVLAEVRQRVLQAFRLSDSSGGTQAA